MTKEQAIAQGCKYYTGIYKRSFEKEKVKQRAKEIREKYKCRAVVVKVPDDKYSRSYSPGGCGYSVYADRKYELMVQKESLENRMLSYPQAEARLREKFNQGQIELEQQKTSDGQCLAKILEELKSL